MTSPSDTSPVWFVSGATGFIGSNLCRSLRATKQSLIKFNRQGDHTFDATSKVGSVGAIESTGMSRKDFGLVDTSKTIFVHTAGISHAGTCTTNPELALEGNVGFTLKALEFCRTQKIQKFILISSGAVYGDQLSKPATEVDLTPAASIYTATKLASELLVAAYAASFGIQGVVLRLGNVYGPDAHADTVIMSILSQRTKPIMQLQSLHPVRDFIFVDDVVSGIVQVSTTKLSSPCQTFNLSAGTGYSIKDVADIAYRISGQPNSKIQQSRADKSHSSLVLDCSKFTSATGWKSSYDLELGLKETLKRMSS